MNDRTLELDPGWVRAGSQVRLEVVQGPHRGRCWMFDHPVELVIGREQPSNLVLSEEKALSRRHLQLSISPPEANLRDLQSRNGTFVNGVRLSAASLASGDRFGVGETEFVYEVIAQEGDAKQSAVGNREGQTLESGPDVRSDSPGPSSPREPSAATVPTFAETRRTGHKTTERQENTVVRKPPERSAGNDLSTVDRAAQHQRVDAATSGGSYAARDDQPKDLKESGIGVGRNVGSYRLDALIGVGGMASVFRASHRRTDDVVAIKFIRGDLPNTDKSMQLFVREATVLTQLRHPRIVQAIELGLTDRRPYLVMEFIPAINLLKLLDTQSPRRKLRTSVWVVLRLLEALYYLHRQGIVHRDVKPGNILAYKQGHRLQVKLADFGLAKLFADAGISGLTSERSLRGTVAYMSPEQFRSSIDAGPLDDLYSCGATLYRLVTGKLPNMLFKSDETLDELHRHNLPAAVVALIARAMAVDPQQRFQSSESFADALRQLGG